MISQEYCTSWYQKFSKCQTSGISQYNANINKPGRGIILSITKGMKSGEMILMYYNFLKYWCYYAIAAGKKVLQLVPPPQPTTFNYCNYKQIINPLVPGVYLKVTHI